MSVHMFCLYIIHRLSELVPGRPRAGGPGVRGIRLGQVSCAFRDLIFWANDADGLLATPQLLEAQIFVPLSDLLDVGVAFADQAGHIQRALRVQKTNPNLT